MAASTVNGDLVVVGTLTAGTIASPVSTDRSNITTDSLAVYNIPFTSMRVWDALATSLPAGIGTLDDFGVVAADYTNTPVLQGKDENFNATDSTVYARFLYPIPIEYVLGGSLKCLITGSYNTSAPDTTGTLDCECRVWDTASGGLGNDIVTTAGQDLMAAGTTSTDFTFSLNSASLSVGDMLDFRLSVLTNDATSGSAVIPEITRVLVKLDAKG